MSNNVINSTWPKVASYLDKFQAIPGLKEEVENAYEVMLTELENKSHTAYLEAIRRLSTKIIGCLTDYNNYIVLFSAVTLILNQHIKYSNDLNAHNSRALFDIDKFKRAIKQEGPYLNVDEICRGKILQAVDDIYYSNFQIEEF